MSRRDDPLVWSSEHGDQRTPAAQAKPSTKRRSPREASGAQADPRDGTVRVRRETQGRKGKGVTTISGVPLDGDALREFAAELKRRCGSGGTLKGAVIEIQGDHVATVLPLLEARGWSVKRAGG